MSPEENLLTPMYNGKIESREISTEMQESYLQYAMSVIVSRALPDARDGLKPVQRRILYAMHDMGLGPNTKYRKSAKIVGEVMAKFHPHGDMSIYGTVVRMAQPFSMRYPMVDGQGNFGSIDGDSAAAQRYTEAKMTAFAEHMGADIEKDTVDFRPNYDATEEEPVVMPTRVPNLLLNGAEGIAVGLATKIPPHNLNEVIDGLTLVLDNPECTTEEVMEKIPGPDFPTSGVIYGGESLKEAYLTGRGKFTIRGVAEIEEKKSGRFDIIITEIPYQVNKALLIEKIADLVNEKRIVGISDLRDESAEDIRIVIELKRDAFPKKILNQLFEYTVLQTDFHMNMIALVDGTKPRLMTLKGMLETFLAHRRVVVTRRTQYELRIAKDRAHILEGLNIALDHIDEIIATIKAAPTKEEASLTLQHRFKLSERQTQAILEMRLQQLAGLERKRIQDEYQKKLALIAELEGILASQEKITAIIRQELLEIKEKYGDERRTKLMKRSLKDFSEEDLIPDEPMVVTLTKSNYIKRLPPSTYRSQHRGGKGVSGITTKEEDSVEHILTTTSHTELFFFTSMGRVFRLKTWEIPQASRTAKGQAIVNLLQLRPDERITAMFPVDKDKSETKYYFMATTGGTVKKTPIEDFSNVRSSGLIAIKLKDNEQLSWVEPTSGENHLMLVTAQGQSVLFLESDVRSMGRASQGVRGIKLKGDDKVVQLLKVPATEGAILVLSRNGYGKMTKQKEFSAQKRGGSGVRISKVTTKTGKLVGAHYLPLPIDQAYDIMVTSTQGQMIRLPVKSIPTIGRSTQGVIVMRLDTNDHVASFTLYQDDGTGNEIAEAATDEAALAL